MHGSPAASVVSLAKRCNAWGVPVAVAALVVYSALASPHIVDGDNAELATLGAIGGRSHPPGYPLYVLWLRAWSWLPGATPAQTTALATAILGALAMLRAPRRVPRLGRAAARGVDRRRDVRRRRR